MCGIGSAGVMAGGGGGGLGGTVGEAWVVATATGCVGTAGGLLGDSGRVGLGEARLSFQPASVRSREMMVCCSCLD